MCADDVPTLENFAYGDTPTRAAVEALVALVLRHEPGEVFAVSEHALSAAHDIRALVLRTLMTYLELDGIVRQGTPFYAGYRLRPVSGTLDDVAGGFDPGRADFLRRLFAAGSTSRIWTSLTPDDAAAALGEDRSRIVAALGHLSSRA